MSDTQWGKRKIKPKHAYEFLEIINTAKPEEIEKELKEHGSKVPLNYLLSLAFSPRIKFDLPEGVPPIPEIEKNKQIHPDLLVPLAPNLPKLKYCLPGVKLERWKKEKIFMDICASVPAKDVDVLVACKDKKLTELYPNITKELIGKVFPAYLK